MKNIYWRFTPKIKSAPVIKKKKMGKEVRNANKFQRNTIFVNFRMKDISGPVWLLKQ